VSAGSPVSSVTMLRFPLFALAVAVLALMAAGCGNGGGHRAGTPTTRTSSSSGPCKLNSAQRRAVALARADIRRLRLIEARVQTFSERGAPKQEQLTGKFELDLGSGKLPLNVYSDLLHRAKAAVRLCGDCSQGLETIEPVLGIRAHPRCG
jgi:hypothetical protein